MHNAPDKTSPGTDVDALPTSLPVLPLRDVVVFPYMIFPVLVGRESSLRAVNEALEHEKYIFLAAQKNSVTEEPGRDDIYHEGTIAKIIQILKLPNGLMKILVDGVVQAVGRRVHAQNGKYLEAEVDVTAGRRSDGLGNGRAAPPHRRASSPSTSTSTGTCRAKCWSPSRTPANRSASCSTSPRISCRPSTSSRRSSSSRRSGNSCTS